MASFIGTLRSALGDQWWFIKFVVALFVVYFAINEAPALIHDTQILMIFYAIVLGIFLGSGTVAMHRNINNISPLFPGISSIHEIIINSVGSLFSIVPGVLICFLFLYLIRNYSGISPQQNIIYFIYGLVVVFSLPLIIIPLILYSVRYRITDIFKINIILRTSGDVLMSIFVYLIQFVLTFGLFIVCLYFFLKQMFNNDFLGFRFIECLLFIVFFYTILIYCSDLYDEVIPAIHRRSKD